MLFLGKKQPGWLQRLFTHDTVKETPGIFTEGHSADEIARNLKMHAPDYQAAMAKLTWFINTMGDRLSAKHRSELERAKHVLRTIYKRQDRIELYEKPMLQEKKEKKVAMMHLVFQDDEGHVHHGDMFVELLGKAPEELEHLKTTSLYHRHMIEQLPVYEKFLKMFFKMNDISKIKEMMMSRYRQKQEVPYWNLDIDKPESAKVASAEGELVFASENDALQSLADLTGQQVIVAADEDEEEVDEVPRNALRTMKDNVVYLDQRRTAQDIVVAVRKIGIADARFVPLNVKDEHGKVSQKFVVVSGSFTSPVKHGMALGAALSAELIRHDQIEK